MKNTIKGLWRSKLRDGILASYANTAVGLASTFVAIPIYLKYLGREEYGLWMTISGVVAYLGLLNFGIAQTTANYFGSAVVRRDAPEQNRALSTGFWFYASIVGSALAVLSLFGPWMPWHLVIKGSADLTEQIKWVFLLAPACFLVELPFTLFGTCLKSIGKIHLQQAIAAAQTVAKLIVALVLLSVGGSLAGLIVALSCTNFVFYFSSYFILKHELPALSVRPRYFDRTLRREMTGPSFFYLVLQISGAIAFSTDALVISAILGTEQVAPYGIAQKIAFMALGVITTVSTNFGPSFLKSYAERSFAQLQARFKKAMLISVGLGSLVCAGLMVIGPVFIPLWIGHENYVGLFPYTMIVGLVFTHMILQPCDTLLMVTGNHRRYAVFAFWEAMLNLGLSILLAPRLGVGGVAMGTLIARVFGAGPVMLWESFRVIRAPVVEPETGSGGPTDSRKAKAAFSR